MRSFNTFPLSITGRRETNQDSYLVLRPSANTVFLAVADGMGGVAGGQIASNEVIKCCQKVIEEFFLSEVTPLQLKEILIRIYNKAQSVIRELTKENPKLTGMGTTLTTLLIIDDKYVWGNLGDSRIYYYSNLSLNQITMDHTQVQDFLKEHTGEASLDFLKQYSNILTRSIDGSSDEPDIFPDVAPYETLKTGEAFLLCSDGLILDKVQNNSQIFLNYLVNCRNLEETANNLVNKAYDEGSNDNITILLCEIDRLKRGKLKLKNYLHHSSKTNIPNKKKISLRIILSISAITFIIILVSLLYFLKIL